MLPKASLLILGVINQKKINAYELVKVLKGLRIKDWLKISDTTIYVTVRKLDEKGMIEGFPYKDLNMPEKILYQITEKGRKELVQNISKIIAEFSYDQVPFSVVMFFIGALKQEEAIRLLKGRLTLLKKYKVGIEEQISKLVTEKVHNLYICNVERNLSIIDNEIHITDKYIQCISNMEDWNIDLLV
jgi:DNA-binding PadR family transcriptional regulator